MAWQTPKTDWKAEYDAAGLFVGDFFNVTDYNRIKNNLLYLRELAAEFLEDVPVIVVGIDKHLPSNANPDFDNDHFFADEFNLIEDALEALDNAIPFADYGDKQIFTDNGKFIDYAELNRIESASLDMYNLLASSIAGRRRLAFRLGARRAV